MIQIKVGEIQGYDVLYLPDKDVVYCKNTALPLSKVIETLRSPLDRVVIPSKNMVILLSDFQVEFGCLSTTRENIKSIHKQIKQYQNERN